MKIRHLIVVVLFMLLAGSAAFAQTPPLYIKQFGSDGIDHLKKLLRTPPVMSMWPAIPMA
jgi:hypothetical protein